MRKSDRWTLMSLNYSDLNHSDLFRNNIHERLYHTDILDELEIKVSQQIMTFISTEPDEINYIGISIRGNKTASKKRRFKIIKALELLEPITKSTLLEKLEKSFHQSTEKFFDKSKFLLPSKFGEALFSYIYNENESVKNQYQKLMDSYDQENVADSVDRIVFNQKSEIEAISLALKASGLFDSYKGFFEQGHESTQGFLSGINSIDVREDLQIMNDSNIFDNWNLTKKDISGQATFSNGSRQVHIVYANRTPIEENIGVDLLYYDEFSKSFVMVQYKRLIAENAKWVYRPDADSNHQKELDLMDSFESSQLLRKDEDYKYNDDIFYFKLCKSKQNRINGSLSVGMYLPKSYWKHLLKSKNTLGPKGGRVFTYDNVQSYLTNTAFIELIKSGLIGSRLEDAAHIESIIKEILESKKVVDSIKNQKDFLTIVRFRINLKNLQGRVVEICPY
ncbi:hypothetical protein [Spirochaeta isovalerica]|uniref:Uncharacterized protein n=1 Tax=Spirochaeta isovalerica TaxID=150 RepID=A0A841RFD5_9SPIO|nr:hypothetical protein [Spirochaeta isovalerica]MBB6481529.1 hypothetical protein [Spirochaeta isovalerica]